MCGKLPAFDFTEIECHSPVSQGFFVEILSVAADIRRHVITLIFDKKGSNSFNNKN